MLDEPTAALSVAQTAEVLTYIERLRDLGHGVILISHNMNDVRAVSDRIVVLRHGRNNGSFDADTASYESILAAITGATSQDNEHAAPDGRAALTPDVHEAVQGVPLSVNAVGAVLVPVCAPLSPSWTEPPAGIEPFQAAFLAVTTDAGLRGDRAPRLRHRLPGRVASSVSVHPSSGHGRTRP